jgi:hypothetical protein
MDVADLVEEISSLGLVDALQKYHNKPLQKEAKSIVAGPSFLQFLNKLFQIQCSRAKNSQNHIKGMCLVVAFTKVNVSSIV